MAITVLDVDYEKVKGCLLRRGRTATATTTGAPSRPPACSTSACTSCTSPQVGDLMRHRQRHLHATIVRHVRPPSTTCRLAHTTPSTSAPPVTLVIDYEPQQAGETPAYNTVSVSIGHQGADEEYELGGGMLQCRYTVFVDVYGHQRADRGGDR
jgi:hypothetical protein